MEQATHKCEICKNSIPEEELEVVENRYFHKKCFACSICHKRLTKEDYRIRNGNLYCKEHFVQLMKEGNIFVPTLISEVAIPEYLEVQSTAKNPALSCVPEVFIYFDISESEARNLFNNEFIDAFKNEIEEMVREGMGEVIKVYLNDIKFGSCWTKIKVFCKELKNIFKDGAKKVIEVIERVVNIVKTKSFKCINNLKPMTVKFINQKSVEELEKNEKVLNEFLSKKGEEEEGNNKNNNYLGSLEKLAEEKENELRDFDNTKEVLEKTTDMNEKFENQWKKSLRESIFEFKITGLAIVLKNEDVYNSSKEKCENCETQILYRSSRIKYLSKSLTYGIDLCKDCWFGLGIYFSDQIDYVRYYYKYDENFNKIPRVGESHSFLAAEVFYNGSKKKRIYDYSYGIVLSEHPSKNKNLVQKFPQYLPEKNGIHYAKVDGKTSHVIDENNKIMHPLDSFDRNSNQILKNGRTEPFPEKRFFGREYVVGYAEQVNPTYGITVQRIEYCVIWRDTNFEKPKYKDELAHLKSCVSEFYDINVYTVKSTEEGIKLISRKKYNKIILITNVGEKKSGRDFVDKARKILNFDVVVLFFGSWIGSIEWIKDYPNSLFTNSEVFVKRYILEYEEEKLQKLKQDLEKSYGVTFLPFENHLTYPLFHMYEKGGHYSSLEIS